MSKIKIKFKPNNELTSLALDKYSYMSCDKTLFAPNNSTSFLVDLFSEKIKEDPFTSLCNLVPFNYTNNNGVTFDTIKLGLCKHGQIGKYFCVTIWTYNDDDDDNRHACSFSYVKEFEIKENVEYIIESTNSWLRCVICLNDYMDSDMAELPCPHKNHVCVECIQKLVNTECPLCRTPFDLINN